MADKILRYIKGAFTENLALKLVSLIIAVSIWAFIMSAKETTVSAEAQLSFVVPEDKVLTSTPPQSALVKFRGPRTALSTWSRRDLTVKVDLSHLPIGQSIVPIDPSNLRLPPGVRVVSITPSQIEVSLERKIRKIVSIVPRLIGTPKAGYRIPKGGVKVNPAEVEVEGPQSEVALLDSIPTEPVVVLNKSEPFKQTVKLKRVSSLVEFRDVESVEVEVEIVPDIITRDVVGVPVKLKGSAASEFQVYPKTITVFVKGLRPVVEKLTEADVVASVNADGTSGTKEIQVVAPKGVEVVRTVPQKVMVYRSNR